jgi:CRISPR-associated exonuclease Cas4
MELNTTFESNMNITGTHIAYYHICTRKLWFFTHHLDCEHSSELIQLGQHIHDASYAEKQKEINLGPVKFDWIDMSRKVIHEVKKTNKLEKAHVWQLKYYLYYLQINGVGDFIGELNYPKLREKKIVELYKEDIPEIETMLQKIETITALPEAPKLEKPMRICKKCSYYELCWI